MIDEEEIPREFGPAVLEDQVQRGTVLLRKFNLGPLDLQQLQVQMHDIDRKSLTPYRLDDAMRSAILRRCKLGSISGCACTCCSPT